MGVGSFFTSKLDEAIGWARKYSIFQYPFVTACCGMEYMATACSHYDIDRFGAGLPRFSPRQADVLFVVGTISHKMAPFECGKDPIALPEGRFAIKFSTIAIFFILIDIELLFIWPWAMLYRRLGWFGFVEMLVFLSILMLGFFYIWRKGGFEWE